MSFCEERGRTNLAANLLVGQSGGATAVMNASLAGVIVEALEHRQIRGVYGALNGIEGLLEGRLVDLRYEDPTTIRELAETPSAALGTCRHRLAPDEEERALDALRRYSIRFFIYIGGNDSADTAHRLALCAARAGYELYVVGVPKTVDNDLPLTDHCPGYGSAARFLALATLDAGRDTEAAAKVYPVKIIEVGGRNAGWLAAASALGKRSDEDAPHLVYVPERPLQVTSFLQDVEQVHRRLGYVVAVVGENVRDERGRPLGSERPRFVDAFGHPYYEGPASFLANLVMMHLGLRARYDKPGTIQRMLTACVSRVDRNEAYLVGQRAVSYALAGVSDQMVTLVREPGEEYRCRTGLAPLDQIANRERKLPPEFMGEPASFLTAAFLNYARPLLGDPLPSYIRLRRVPVPLSGHQA